MASIKDAFEESITDRLAIIKYFLFAIPLYISYTAFTQGNMDLFYAISIFTLLVLTGLLVKCINNVRNGKNYVLPSFNIFNFTATVFKLIFAIGPMLWLGLYLGNLICQIQIPIPLANIQLIYTIIVWLIIGSIVITSIILYAKTEHIKDAYNIKLISEMCIDILVAIIFYIPQIALINAIIIGIAAYLFGLFWDLNSPIYIYICCMTIVMDIAITGNYLAQVDYELVPREKEN